MNPGKLNRRIVIQARTISKDATASRVETWADSATVWAEAVVQRGAEALPADSERFLDTRQFRIRHRTIDPASNRVLYQSRFYDIRGVTDEGLKTTLLLDTIATQSVI